MQTLRELATSLLLGAIGYAILLLFFSLAALLRNGYAPRYLKLSCMPRLRCPRPLGAFASFGADLLAVLLVFGLLTVYDFGVLGGMMGLPHVGCFLLGFICVRRIYGRFSVRIVSPLLSIALELLLLPVGLILYPIRLLLSKIFRLLCRILLICRGKCAKLKAKRAIRRYTAGQLGLAQGAFLPHDLTV